jgi:dTDP-4-amino-4,6-dideoxygalactose transaminase
VKEFERTFCRKLGIRNFVAMTNGTIALQIAIKALGLKGEIITSPFTWIATVSAIKWEGSIPVFADIDPGTLNIDPARIEEKITSQTVAIMPVHVFGNPCDVDAIGEIARRHRIKVIYDAAHAVGSVYKGKSLLEAGDISATSLHATKLLNTAEGGGCITCDEELHEKMKRIRFFGHDERKEIVEDGMNGKMTEVHAALGMVNLEYMDKVLADRKRKYTLYKKLLGDHKALRFQEFRHGRPNFSYFPVIFQSEAEMLRVEKALNGHNIFPRRYFYPSVNTYTRILPYQPTPVSEDISPRILCLPLFYSLMDDVIEKIAGIIKSTL